MSTRKSNIFGSFGLALKEALDRMGVTPTWLSKISGKDKGQISKYINDKLVPKRVIQLELAKYLRYEIIELDSGWELVEKKNRDRVEEETGMYEVVNYAEEKKYLKKLFKEMQSIEKIFDEIDTNKELSSSERKLQTEMIKEKIVRSIRNITS